MKQIFALVAAAFVVTSSPALAAGQTIGFTSGVYTNPAWATATIVQDFTGQTNGNLVATGTTGAGGTSVAPAVSDSREGTASLISNATRTGMTGNYLSIGRGTGASSSYTLNFDATTGVQFVSFVLGNYKAGVQSVVVQYVTGATSTVNLLAGAGSGALSGLVSGATGLFYIDQGGGPAIKSIKFRDTSGTAANNLFIDNISAATPEPAAWMMMIFGFGLAGAQLRRRRATVKFAAA